MKTDSSKEKAVDLAVTQIERQFGKGAIMKAGRRRNARGTPTISTGSLSLDLALGVGDCRRDVLWRFMGLRLQARRPWPFMLLQRRKRRRHRSLC